MTLPLGKLRAGGNVQRRYLLCFIPVQAEQRSGPRRKVFDFAPEFVFAFSPESCSTSPRNAVRNRPGTLFGFLRIPHLVLELARCEWIARRENVLCLGNSGTGKTHIALALGLAACQRGLRVRFTTAAALVNELLEARDEKRLLRYQRHLQRQELLIVDELGFVPLTKAGAELLFEIFSQRYERCSTLVTSNLPFAEWTEVLGSERLTGALLDRLTHHVHILEMNGDSYRLKTSKQRRAAERAK